MWLKNFWVTIIAIAAISSFIGSSRAQYEENTCRQSTKYEKNKVFWKRNTQDTENISPFKNNSIGMYSHQMLFGDIMANSMNNFVPFSNFNKNCTRDGQQYIKSLNDQTLWAIQMYDSSSKYARGTVMATDMTELGYFDQCMSVSSKKFGIRGAYAIAVVQFRFSDENDIGRRPLNALEVEIKQKISSDSPSPRSAGPKTLWWALCVPDSCTNEDVKLSVEQVLIPVFRDFNTVVDVTVAQTMFTSKDSELANPKGALLIYGIFITGFVLVVIGTLYDVISDHSKAKNPALWSVCLHSYSMVSNIRNLMDGIENREFTVPNGLKSLGVITIILTHRILLNLGVPMHNTDYTEHIFNDFWWSIVKSPVVVEIFFTISGFLTFTVIKDRLNSGKSLNVKYLLISRLVRILPTYTTVILIFAFILPYTGDGPLWKHIVYSEAEYCRKNWWTNILFINNYVNTREMCMIHSWYLACDIHFHLVGIVLTYIVWRWRRAGLGAFGFVFAASVYIPAKYIYDNQQWGIFPVFHSTVINPRTTEHFQRIYVKSHYRITTYLIGLAAAYVYMQMKNFKFTFSVKSRTIGFMMCLSLNFTCLFMTGYLYLPGLKYNPWNQILFFTFQRIIVALTISYVLVVGSLSNFGHISRIFECKLATILARLSYVLYLSHFIVQLQSIGRIRQPQYGSLWTINWESNADILTALSYSLVISLIIEEPISKIIKPLIRMYLDNKP